jgi:hypothetical protein
MKPFEGVQVEAYGYQPIIRRTGALRNSVARLAAL